MIVSASQHIFFFRSCQHGLALVRILFGAVFVAAGDLLAAKTSWVKIMVEMLRRLL